MKRTLALDPLSTRVRYELLGFSLSMRRFEEERKILEEALLLFPDQVTLYWQQAYLAITADGDLQSARSLLNRAIEEFGFAESDFMTPLWKIDRFSGDHSRTLSRNLRNFDSTTTPADKALYYLLLAEAYHYSDSAARSRAYYDSARVCVEPLQAFDRPWGSGLPPSLGIIYARLGRNEDAVQAALHEVETFPLAEDAMIGSEALQNLAITYALVGEQEKAIDVLEELMSIPSDVTVAVLRLEPFYDSLRDNPRFQALLAKGDKVF
jgi:tetratricopeptide (TPR) repeat protein